MRFNINGWFEIDGLVDYDEERLEQLKLAFGDYIINGISQTIEYERKGVLNDSDLNIDIEPSRLRRYPMPTAPDLTNFYIKTLFNSNEETKFPELIYHRTSGLPVFEYPVYPPPITLNSNEEERT